MFRIRYRSLPALVALITILQGCGASPSPTTTTSALPTSSPAAKVRPVEGQVVSIPTEAAARNLDGTLYGKSDVAVIFSNMGAQRQETWGAFVQDVAAKGYMVLTYNMRYWVTDTEIEGSLRNKAAEDLIAAVNFVRTQGAKSIVLVGASLGGMATAKVAAAENPAAVVIMAAPMSANGLDFRVEESEVKQITAPKLFIYSQDESKEISDGLKQMYDLAPQPKEIHAYPGTAHGTDLFETEHRADLIQRLLDFIGSHAPIAP